MREPYNTRFKFEYSDIKEGYVYAPNKEQAFQRLHNVFDVKYEDYSKKDIKLTKDPVKRTD